MPWQAANCFRILEFQSSCEGTPKGNLLGIDGRLKEGLRAKLDLHPYQEGQCHRGIVNASKIWVFMESMRKI